MPPQKLENKLKREVESKHPSYSNERKNKFIYGTLRSKTGWAPSTTKKS